MPYKHAGEIGDVWKHLPLCDILSIEKPKRYFETNAAYPSYILPELPQKEFGVFHFCEHAKREEVINSNYFKLLDLSALLRKRIYLGSPGLAMEILREENTSFYFHDLEEEPLSKLKIFAQTNDLEDRVSTFCGDSISKFLNGDYHFVKDDFVFIDPYAPFDGNEAGQTFFDVFCKASINGAKILLWYGFENLKERRVIHSKIQSFTMESGIPINTYDIWLSVMSETSCPINPGVPGCGLAAVNLTKESLSILSKYLNLIEQIYQNAKYDGAYGSLKVCATDF